MTKVDGILKTNNERLEKNKAVFDPYIGEGCPDKREWLFIDDYFLPSQYVPVEMFDDVFIQSLINYGSIERFITEFLQEDYNTTNRDIVVRHIIDARIKHDVYYWFASLNKIKNKHGGANIPFVLNRPQRKLISEYERMRKAGVPIRLILLKARQWGGSTATQLYIAWIQLVHKTGWYSSIVAQDNSTAQEIREMYSKMLADYPPELLGLPPESKLEFGSYGKSGTSSIIKYNNGTKIARDTVVSVGSVLSPNSIRGSDIAMCHFSEVGVWKETTEWNASNIITSVVGSILDEPLTMIVLESTAKGTGNYFHTAWLRANKDANDPDYSGYTPLFVAWFEIDMYSKDFDSEKERIEFANWLYSNRNSDKPDVAPDSGQYYWYLWTIGATLENINWYIGKRRSYEDHSEMASEYPSDPVEAFKHSGEKTFSIYKLEELRKTCSSPEFIGDVTADGTEGKEALRNPRFVADEKGNLSVWEMPDTETSVSDRYIVIVDPQKGRSKGADNSCILVLDRYWLIHGGVEVVVAEWSGHIDKDLLAWKSAQVAKLYNNAYLVIERNTYDQDKGKSMDESEFIIDLVYEHYDNMHIHTPEGKTIDKEGGSVGFHTNRYTKPTIINNLIMAVREGAYIEKSSKAVDEMNTYERKDDGNWGAMSKHKDDRVMVRAIGLHISRKMDMPRENRKIKYKSKTVRVITNN